MPQLPRQEAFVPMKPQEMATTSPDVAGAMGGAVGQFGGELMKVGERLLTQKHIEDRATAMTEGESARSQAFAEYQNFTHDMMQPGSGVDPKTWTATAQTKLEEIGKRYSDSLKTSLKGNIYAGHGLQRLVTGLREDGMKHLGEKVMTAQDHVRNMGIQSSLSDFAHGQLSQVELNEKTPDQAVREYNDFWNASGLDYFHTPDQKQAKMKEFEAGARLAPYTGKMNSGGAPKLYEQFLEGKLAPEIKDPELRAELVHKVMTVNGQMASASANKDAADERRFRHVSDGLYKDALSKLGPSVAPDQMLNYDQLKGMQSKLEPAQYHTLNGMVTEMTKAGGPGNAVEFGDLRSKIIDNPGDYTYDQIVSISNAHGFNRQEKYDAIQTWAHEQSLRREQENDPNHFRKAANYDDMKKGIMAELGPSSMVRELVKPQEDKAIRNAELEFDMQLQHLYAQTKRPLTVSEMLAIRQRVVADYQAFMGLGAVQDARMIPAPHVVIKSMPELIAAGRSGLITPAVYEREKARLLAQMKLGATK